jgi:hypothetical protein
VTTLRLATQADDELIRRLLRTITMPTWVEMAIEREPSFFAAKDLFGQDWAVLAEEEGDTVGMYTAAVLPVHVDGRPEQLGYLGGLRVHPRYRGRIRYLREGYASIEPLAPVRRSLPWWFTVVTAQNDAARRLLEAGVAGLPPYHFQGDYITYVLPTARGKLSTLWRQAAPADVPRIVDFHNTQAAAVQYSPVLDELAIRRIGHQQFFVHEYRGALAGVAALWDQRAFKQIVARRYRGAIRSLVPAYNVYAKLFGRLPLPAEGNPLQQTFIAFLALGDSIGTNAYALLQDLLARCWTPAASVGLHAGHPLARTVEQFKPICYPAKVYAVSFDSARPAMDVRPVQPEAALL